MNKKQYEEKRKALTDAARALINEGKITEANAKMREIQELDASFEAEARALADLNALAGAAPSVINLENMQVSGTHAADNADEDLTNSLDYRKAFKNFVMTGTQNPSLKNADANTKTTDAGVLIPTVIIEKIIQKMQATGMILPRMTRTSYKGGVKIPKSMIQIEASWVSEGSGSDKQKKSISGTIDFGYNKLRCAVSMSLEVDQMALPVFEAQIADEIGKAMVKAIEIAAISGSGSGQPKGVLTETVPAGQNVDIPADGPTYQTLVDAEAALPLEYEAGAVWNMTKKTFMKFVGMVDESGQPIARINYGIHGKPERYLLGREVVLNSYMASYAASPSEDTVVGFLFDWEQYMLNSNMGITVKRYEDNDTDDEITKAIMLVDGKAISVEGLVTLTNKAAAA